MKTAKIGALFLVSVMAIAAIGTGYALWHQDLTIDVEIHTGTFCVGVRNVAVGDMGPDPNYPPGDNSEGKDVAETISINDPHQKGVKCTKAGIDYYHDVKEIVNNAYPWYASSVTIAFANCGTIPAKINKAYIMADTVDDPDNIMQFLMLNGVTATDTDTANNNVVDVNIPQDLEGFQHQLHPCHVLEITINFYFIEWLDLNENGVEDEGEPVMPETANAYFTYFIQWAQWNEVP
jgi:hypothetical protein